MKHVLITGGAGFIGSNTAQTLARQKFHVTILDNLSRVGVKENISILQKKYPEINTVITDAQKTNDYLTILKQADVIIHLAGQTAVTNSLKNPSHDFANNLQASFRLLEAVRKHNPGAICLYASTNKVYGDLKNHRYLQDKSAQKYQNTTAPQGIDESQPLSFISPYGCSKGSADQYFLDYARSYNLNTVVFRQSCIYGPFQQGVEDQGWVAHFAKQVLAEKPITIFGDGYQVRDLLYIDDLITAYRLAIDHIDTVAGLAFNIGGGPQNSYSLLNVIDLLNQVGYRPDTRFQPARMGDQLVFISDNSLLKEKLGWEPTTAFPEGLNNLLDWLREH